MVQGETMRILVAQIYGLGNAILTTPLLKALSVLGDVGNRTHEVHVVADPKRKAAIEVLKTCPGVKKIWSMGDTNGIQRYHFDVLIMCCDYAPIVQRFKIPRVEWAFLRRNPGEDRVQWFQRWPVHEMEMAFAVARKFGFKSPMPEPHVPSTKVDITYPGPRLALGIGYFKGDDWSKKKHWGNENFVEIAKRFRMFGGMSFLLGDKKDYECDGRDIVSEAGDSIISLCGKLGLRGTLGALKSCDIYLGNDTGLAHAAAAYGMPTLSIFKPWNHSFVKNRPYGEQGHYAVEWSGLDIVDAVWHWLQYEVERLPEKKKK